MNTTIVTIIIIIITILVIKYIANYNQEDFTNDEAIQNVASLYNQAKLSVTDFTSTGVSTLNTVKANNLTVPIVNSTTLTNTGVATLGTVNANAITAPTLNATTLNVANGASINGQTNLISLNVGYNVAAGTDISAGGNLSVAKDSSLNNVNVKGRMIFPTKDNVAGSGSYLQVYAAANDANDCLNKCLANPASTCASFRKSDKMCHCWGVPGYSGSDNNWTTTLFI
jgi:hypothetical protein